MADMGGLFCLKSIQMTPTHFAEASGMEAWACCYAPISCNNREDKTATQPQTEFKPICTSYVGFWCSALRQTG